MILTKSLKNSRCWFWVKMQACGNKIDFCSLFFNIFVDFNKTELFIIFFVLILFIIMTFVFVGEGWWWWHVSLFSPLPLPLCYYQFISLCLEDSGYINLSWELYMHTTLLRNCVWLYMWRHIFEDTCLRKKIQELFYFKIKFFLFWIEKCFLKNSNELNLKTTSRDFLLCAIFICTTSSTNFEQEFLHWLISLSNKV